MNKTNVMLCFLFILLFSCASHKTLVEDIEERKKYGDVLDLLSRMEEEAQSNNMNFTEQEISGMTTILDSLCDSNIKVAPLRDLEKLQQRIDRIAEPDDTVLRYAVTEKKDRLATSLRELKFRTLVKSQQQMTDAFNLSSAENSNTKDGREKEQHENSEIHGRWVFDKQISYTLPYIQANQRYSIAKSTLLLGTIHSLSAIDSTAERRRCWLAIERMLDEIEVQKSEIGYSPFQRSAQGIFTEPGKILAELKIQQEQEIDDEILAYATEIIGKLEKQLNEKIDGNFLEMVEESRELNQKFLNDLKKDHTEPRGKIANDAVVSAATWFDMGFNTDNNQLKIEYNTEAIELNPEFAEAYINRGNVFKALKKDIDAFQDFSKAIELKPEFVPAYVNRGNIYQNMNQHEKAVLDYSKALELAPAYTVAYNYRGNSYKHLRLYDKALNDYTNAIELDPQLASAYNNRGDVYRLLNKNNEAIADYTTAIQLDSHFALAYDNRGLCYRNLKKYDEAIKDHEQAIKLMPDFADAYYNLGSVYWIAKNWYAVIRAWEKCLELNPDHQQAMIWLPKAKENLRQLQK